MERSFRDDLKAALAVPAGATLGYFVLGVDEVSVLLGHVFAAVVGVGVLTVVRRAIHGRRTHPSAGGLVRSSPRGASGMSSVNVVGSSRRHRFTASSSRVV
jgi:hypothetical protein